MPEFLLAGPRGDDALGFLTAAGALLTLDDAGYGPRLAWRGFRPVLVLNGNPAAGTPPAPSTPPALPVTDPETLVAALHAHLKRSPGARAAETETAGKRMERAKTALNHKREEIRKRAGDRQARSRALQEEAGPLESELARATGLFKELLLRNAPDPSVTLGKNLTETNAALFEHSRAASAAATLADRRWADLAAAYGVADPGARDERMLATPWALISGGSQQNFLSTVQSLMVECELSHIKQALFGSWEPMDLRHSLRLDAREDRRYALMARDPTASGNEPRTSWGANRLAFEALRLFPCMPTRGGMAVQAWRARATTWQDDCHARWPLWSAAATVDVVRSLMTLEDIWCDDLAARRRLIELGVAAVMETRRISVVGGGSKRFNLTPTALVWSSADAAAAGSVPADDAGSGRPAAEFPQRPHDFAPVTAAVRTST
jgi:hypothetical protein